MTHWKRFEKHGFAGGNEYWKRPDGVILEEKVCTFCLEKLPATKEFFAEDANKKDGLSCRCKRCHNAICKQANQDLRFEVIKHYSNGELKCACCGEAIYEFLTLDHINGDGKAHRKAVGTGAAMYRWIIRNDFPPMFKVLCQNCNFAKGVYGHCPHQTESVN